MAPCHDQIYDSRITMAAYPNLATLPKREEIWFVQFDESPLRNLKFSDIEFDPLGVTFASRSELVPRGEL
jgi:hypothetical protein